MLKDYASIEVPPAVEGRNMSMVLVPIKRTMGQESRAAETKKGEADQLQLSEKKASKPKTEKKTVEAACPSGNQSGIIFIINLKVCHKIIGRPFIFLV